jgi:hypothetical protein
VTGQAVVDDDREHHAFLVTCEADCLDSCEVLSECSEGTLRDILPGIHAVGIGTLLLAPFLRKDLLRLPSQDMHPIVLGLRYFFGHLKNFFKKFLTNHTVCTQCRQTAEVFIVLSPVAERKGDVHLFRAEEYVHNWTNAILFKESIKNARQAVSSYPHDNLLQSFNKNIEGVFDAPMPSEGRRPLKKNRERPM